MNDPDTLARILREAAPLLGPERYLQAMAALGQVDADPADARCPMHPLDAALLATRVLSTAVSRRHLAQLRQALAQPALVAAEMEQLGAPEEAPEEAA